MGHYLTQQLVHVFWSTDKQQYKIPLAIRNQLYAYLSTVIKSKEGKLYLAGGHDDHIHCLISLPPTLSLSSLMQLAKSNSSKWLKHRPFIDIKFAWEDGFTAMSVQNDRVDAVCAYIKDEENRHKKVTFKDERAKILMMQHIQYEQHNTRTNTNAKLLMHLIWSTKNRAPFLDKDIRPNLYHKMSDAVVNAGGVIYTIGGVEDHVHILMETPRDRALCEVINDIKVSASHWIISRGQPYQDFQWQIGYGAFSISLSTMPAVKQYIANQEEHHKTSTFVDEWNDFISHKGALK